MSAYSKDLRLKVLAAVERGVPRKEISRLLGISLATISRYAKRKPVIEAVRRLLVLLERPRRLVAS